MTTADCVELGSCFLLISDPRSWQFLLGVVNINFLGKTRQSNFPVYTPCGVFE